MTEPLRDHVMILGVGNLLFRDEGVGIHVLLALQERYEFDANVSLYDGGTLGLNLLGVISEADHLIVVDAIRDGGVPASIAGAIEHEQAGGVPLLGGLLSDAVAGQHVVEGR